MTIATISALERRSRLIDRQPLGVRRRSTRVLSRLAVLLAFDLAAYVAARFAALELTGSSTVFGSPGPVPIGPLAQPGAPGSLVFPITLFAALLLIGSYARHRSPVVAVRIFGATIVAASVTAVTLATVQGVRGAILYAAAFGLVCVAGLMIGRGLGEAFAAHVWPRNLALLPAVALRADRSLPALSRRGWGDYGIVEELWLPAASGRDVSDTVRRLHELAETHTAEAVITTEHVADEQLVPLVHEALDLGYRIIYPARAVPIEGVRPRILWHDGEPFFEVGTPVLRTSALFAKRTTDLIGALILLVVAAPLMAAIAVAIRLDSRGPVLFTQARAGLGGRRFRMLKFRTMTEGADDQKHELAHLNRSGDARLFKILSDPRVTPVGRFLRRWSLDELPQLVNVLRGEMSLVGPRPLFEADFAAYEDRHFRRLDTKPGITGLWQVSGRSDVVDFEDVIFLDRQYIEQWSIWLDLSILARTIPAVLRRDGAY